MQIIIQAKIVDIEKNWRPLRFYLSFLHFEKVLMTATMRSKREESMCFNPRLVKPLEIPFPAKGQDKMYVLVGR